MKVVPSLANCCVFDREQKSVAGNFFDFVISSFWSVCNLRRLNQQSRLDIPPEHHVFSSKRCTSSACSLHSLSHGLGKSMTDATNIRKARVAIIEVPYVVYEWHTVLAYPATTSIESPPFWGRMGEEGVNTREYAAG